MIDSATDILLISDRVSFALGEPENFRPQLKGGGLSPSFFRVEAVSEFEYALGWEEDWIEYVRPSVILVSSNHCMKGVSSDPYDVSCMNTKKTHIRQHVINKLITVQT